MRSQRYMTKENLMFTHPWLTTSLPVQQIAGSIRGWIKPKPNTTGVTSGAGNACTFGAPEFVFLDLQLYMYVLQIVVCSFVLFLLATVLSVLLRYTDSDYSFGIFKLFYKSVLADSMVIIQRKGEISNIVWIMCRSGTTCLYVDWFDFLRKCIV